MRLSFDLGFQSRTRANTAAETLKADGYEVTFPPQPDERLVVVTATRPSALSAIQIAATQSRMHVLACELGGEFLGHSGSPQLVLPADPPM